MQRFGAEGVLADTTIAGTRTGRYLGKRFREMFSESHSCSAAFLLPTGNSQKIVYKTSYPSSGLSWGIPPKNTGTRLEYWICTGCQNAFGPILGEFVPVANGSFRERTHNLGPTFINLILSPSGLHVLDGDLRAADPLDASHAHRTLQLQVSDPKKYY